MTSTGTISKGIATYACSTSFDDLPEEVVAYTKTLFLDLIGCALSGVDTDEALIARKLVESIGGAGPSSIWGTLLKTNPACAALINGVTAHAQELDDFGGCDHSGAVIIPALLAIAEAEGIEDGKRVIDAVAAGYEFGVRMLDVFGGYRAHNNPGWHSTGTCGSVAAAIASAKLLGLGPSQMQHAIGIAGNMMSGTWSFLADGAMTKRLNAGRAAETGVVSAYLAKSGFTGPSQVFESDWGGIFTTFTQDPVEPELFFKALGSDYGVMRSGIKPHASCRGAHSGIDSALELREQLDDSSQIQAINIRTNKLNFRTLANKAPKTRLAAQMSLPFSVAAAFARGDVALDAFEEPFFSSAELQFYLDKTSIVLDESLVGETPAIVEITLENGEQRQAQTEIAVGDPENPLSSKGVEAKYRNLAQRVLSAPKAAHLKQAIESLENDCSLKDVLSLLQTSSTHTESASPEKLEVSHVS